MQKKEEIFFQQTTNINKNTIIFLKQYKFIEQNLKCNSEFIQM